MFTWVKGRTLARMIAQGVEGAGGQDDPWLNRWVAALPGLALRPEPGVRILDINYDNGVRGYRDQLLEWNPETTFCRPSALDRFHGSFDLISLISCGGPQSFEPVDFDNPFPFAMCLNQALGLLAPGGAIILSYIYCFDEDHRTIRSAIEPAALYNSLMIRGLHPLSGTSPAVDRISIYHHPDTVFLHHDVNLPAGRPQVRGTRVFMAMMRQGPRQKLSIRKAEELFL